MDRSTCVNRRTLLRGVGAGLALPWLETLASKGHAGEIGKPPVRLGFFYVPNGVHMPAWRPEREGSLGELPTTLSSLEVVRDSITVISDLAADHCDGNGAAHEPAGGGFLVGKKCKHSEEPEVGGRSVDQVAAREIGLETPVDSLALGIDPGHRGDHGYSGTYMSHISWRSKTSPSALELNPKQLYDRLFRGEKPVPPNWSEPKEDVALESRSSLETSVLDLVREDTRALQRQLGFSDKRRLEEYLEGIHTIERRVVRSQADRHSHHQDAFTEDPLLHADEREIPELIIPDGRGIPSEYEEHVNLILDILTLAFQTDTTRVASFMFSYEKSGRSYPQIEAPGSHHSTSHHKKKKENWDQLTKINSHHVQLFSRMLGRMSKIREGEGTLLDNVLFLYGGGISDGNRHNHDDLPILLAGGAGGALQGDRHIKLGEKTPICNLYLEMLSAVSVHRESFGNSNGRLRLLEGSA